MALRSGVKRRKRPQKRRSRARTSSRGRERPPLLLRSITGLGGEYEAHAQPYVKAHDAQGKELENKIEELLANERLQYRSAAGDAPILTPWDYVQSDGGHLDENRQLTGPEMQAREAFYQAELNLQNHFNEQRRQLRNATKDGPIRWDLLPRARLRGGPPLRAVAAPFPADAEWLRRESGRRKLLRKALRRLGVAAAELQGKDLPALSKLREREVERSELARALRERGEHVGEREELDALRQWKEYSDLGRALARHGARVADGRPRGRMVEDLRNRLERVELSEELRSFGLPNVSDSRTLAELRQMAAAAFRAKMRAYHGASAKHESQKSNASLEALRQLEDALRTGKATIKGRFTVSEVDGNK